METSDIEGQRDRESGGHQGPGAGSLRPEVAGEAARILTRALAQVEAMLDRAEGRSSGRPTPPPSREYGGEPDLTELRRSLRLALDRLEAAIDHVGIEEQRLSDQVAELGLVIERLERRLEGIVRLLERGVSRLAPAAPEPIPEMAPATAPPAEPCFGGGGEGVGLVIAGVPGFQGLMEVQRGLTRLPAVESASVKRYQDGEASIELLLREPATASQIVEGISSATGASIIIEEARPEASRLRLRFSGARP